MWVDLEESEQKGYGSTYNKVKIIKFSTLITLV